MFFTLLTLKAPGSALRMATFAPSSHPPMLCEHNHAVINDGGGNAIGGICGESFETDEGLPTFEDCLLSNSGGANSVRDTQACEKNLPTQW